MKFFKTWIDWWLFIPLSLVIAIGSYWFVPFLLDLVGMPAQDMQYTGTAWIYGLFQSWVIFLSGTGVTFFCTRFYYAKIHKYHESDMFDYDFANQPASFKVRVSLLIPAVLFIGYCLICLAAFK